MNNDTELGSKVARLLDRSLDDIKQGTLYRLQSARRASLEDYRVAETDAVAIGGGVGMLTRSGYNAHDRHFNAKMLLLLATLLLALAGTAYWQILQQDDDNEEIDSLLLSDDLPINAYLDKGFDAWLTHSSQ